jgi:hypothetical protein
VTEFNEIKTEAQEDTKPEVVTEFNEIIKETQVNHEQEVTNEERTS